MFNFKGSSAFFKLLLPPNLCVAQSISSSAHLGEVLHQGPAVHLAFVEAWRHYKGGVGSSSRHLLSQPHSCSGGCAQTQEKESELTSEVTSEEQQQQLQFPPNPPSSSPVATRFLLIASEATLTHTPCLLCCCCRGPWTPLHTNGVHAQKERE